MKIHLLQTKLPIKFQGQNNHPWQGKLGNTVIWHQWTDYETSHLDKDVPVFVHLEEPLGELLEKKLSLTGMSVHGLNGGKRVITGDIPVSKLQELAELEEVRVIRGAVQLSLLDKGIKPHFGACSASYAE